MGVITQRSTGGLRFAYLESWLARPRPTPLSLAMPVAEARYGDRQLLPFLQGLLPENVAVIESIARTHHVSPNSPFALLAHIGDDVVGALQILPPGAPSSDAEHAHTGTPLTEPRLQQLLNDAIDLYTSTARPHVDFRISIAGQQPKLALIRAGDGWAVPHAGTASTHIFKPVRPAQGRFPDADIVEALTLDAAGRTGSIRRISARRFRSGPRRGTRPMAGPASGRSAHC